MRPKRSVEELKELLSYEPDTGNFYWRSRPDSPGFNARHAGAQADHTDHQKGYRMISVLGERLPAGRVAWLFVHGGEIPEQIDHIDGNKANNRISNLRLATASQQKANTRMRITNRSGFKGVTQVMKRQKWRATIMKDHINHRLGQFDTPEAAHAAYCEAAKRLFGEFARTS